MNRLRLIRALEANVAKTEQEHPILNRSRPIIERLTKAHTALAKLYGTHTSHHDFQKARQHLYEANSALAMYISLSRPELRDEATAKDLRRKLSARGARLYDLDVKIEYFNWIYVSHIGLDIHAMQREYAERLQSNPWRDQR